METVRCHCHARAGLVGNPSDGYNGKTVSVIIRNFHAEVMLVESERIEFVPGAGDHKTYASPLDVVRDVKMHGYYGGLRLLKAATKRFAEYCVRKNIALPARNFKATYESNVPRQVGLAGSTAIIVSTLRALMKFYDVAIPLEVQPSLALAVENEELKITAGLQDRVIEVYEGCVYMNFAKEHTREIDGYRCGLYERLDPKLLPPLYLAYKTDLSEPTEVFHNDIRGRYDHGEAVVVNAMTKCAELAAQAREAILARDGQQLGRLIDANFDQRRSIYKLPAAQVEMVDVARRLGASGHFAGSGGATIGTYRDEAMFKALERDLGALGCRVIKPEIV